MQNGDQKEIAQKHECQAFFAQKLCRNGDCIPVYQKAQKNERKNVQFHYAEIFFKSYACAFGNSNLAFRSITMPQQCFYLSNVEVPKVNAD